MRVEEFLGGFLDSEVAIVKQWGAMDPTYGDNAWDRLRLRRRIWGGACDHGWLSQGERS